MKKKYIAFLVLLMLPMMAHANAGTPLMWASMLHLVVGNMFIGFLEGAILMYAFKIPREKALSVMVLANYISAWLGGLFITGKLVGMIEITIDNLHFWFWTFMVIAFVVTLLLELPFVFLLLRKQENRVKKTIKATLIIHLVSYSILVSWYWMSSGTSILTQLEAVETIQIESLDEFTLYYISEDGKNLIKSDISGNDFESVVDFKDSHNNCGMFVTSESEGQFEIRTLDYSNHDKKKPAPVILRGKGSIAIKEDRITSSFPDDVVSPYSSEYSQVYFDEVPSFDKDSPLSCNLGFWPGGGIYGHVGSKDKFRFSLETPYVTWSIRNATQINDELVLFQLGVNQICLLNISSKKITLIVHGKGPVVVKNKSDAN